MRSHHTNLGLGKETGHLFRFERFSSRMIVGTLDLASTTTRGPFSGLGTKAPHATIECLVLVATADLHVHVRTAMIIVLVQAEGRLVTRERGKDTIVVALGRNLAVLVLRTMLDEMTSNDFELFAIGDRLHFLGILVLDLWSIEGTRRLTFPSRSGTGYQL